MKLDLPVMAAALIAAAALQESLPAVPPFPGCAKLQLLPGVALYYVLARPWQMSLCSAIWAGVLSDSLGSLPAGTTAFPLLVAALIGVAIRDATLKRSAISVFLEASLLLAFILAAQRLRLAVARLLPFSAMDILRDAVWTVPLSAAIAAFAFRILSRIDLIAENVVPGKGGDSQ